LRLTTPSRRLAAVETETDQIVRSSGAIGTRSPPPHLHETSFSFFLSSSRRSLSRSNSLLRLSTVSSVRLDGDILNSSPVLSLLVAVGAMDWAVVTGRFEDFGLR